MIKYSFKPEKKLAQYFLVDDGIIKKLIDAVEIKKQDVVAEIGAGCGFITRQLIKKCRKLIAYEIDEKLQALLKAELGHYKNLEIRGDFLKERNIECDKVVGSLPYSISSEIMYKLFQSTFSIAALIVDDEFAEKLVSFEGMPDYVAVSVLSQYFFNIKLLHKVPKESFFPIPKTDSFIIQLKKKKPRVVAKNNIEFIKFIKALFCYKNKNLRKALSLAGKKLNKKLAIQKLDSELTEIKEEKVMLLAVNDLVKVFNLVY